MSVGGSSQKSSSSSAGESFGMSDSWNNQLGVSTGRAGSQDINVQNSFSQGGGSSSSALDRGQSAMQQQLFNRSQGLYGQANQLGGQYGAANAGWMGQNQGNTGFNQGMSAMGAGQQMQGMGYLNQFAQQDNPYLQAQINQYGADIGRNLSQNILPGITGAATVAGQRGSSRQGIAQGMAAQAAQEQFGRGAGDMRMAAYGQQQAAANSLAGYGGQMYGTGGQLTGEGLGRGQQQINQYYDQQQMMGLRPFQIGQSIVGAPSVLQRGNTFTQSGSQGLGFGSSFNNQNTFDITQAGSTARDYSYNNSTSKGKGASANFGLS